MSREGIYVRELEHRSPEDRRAAMDLMVHLESIETWAREIVAPHVERTEALKGRVCSLDMGDGPDMYRVADDMPEVARDAIEALNHARSLRYVLEQRDERMAGLWGLCLGRVVERMGMRPFEPLVETGRLIHNAAHSQQKTLDEMRRQVDEWDRMIVESGAKKREAFRRLRIPRQTYYRYKKALKESVPKS